MINLKNLLKIKSIVSHSSSQSVAIELNVVVDNRQLDESSLFVAIKGARYNPMKDLKRVRESHCRFIVCEYNEENKKIAQTHTEDFHFIFVNNIEKAIAEIGKEVAESFKRRGGKILAISGSNGKTTTKEMCFHMSQILLGAGKTICTQKNNNNHLGVPFTLFQITHDTEFAIVELGSNATGEIEFLCNILTPQFGITTNIGDTHLEFFKNREAVLLEEGILKDYTSNLFFLNQDDTLLKSIKPKGQVISYGEAGDDYKFGFSGQSEVSINGEKLLNSAVTGKHNKINLCVSVVMLKEIFSFDIKKIISAAASFKPTRNRSEWIIQNKQKIYLDAYNANPSSMKVALEAFMEHTASIGAKGSDIALILGDMNELGENTPTFHEELGSLCNQFEVDQVTFIGKYAKYSRSKYSGNSEVYLSVEDAKDHIQQLNHQYLFIKGSRSLQLERILDIK